MRKPIRVALVEPNQPDAHWFRLMLEELGLPAEVNHYTTGLNAIEDWSDSARPAIDLIIVADVLPILALAEFVHAAKVLNPRTPIVVVAEPIGATSLHAESVPCYAKPLMPEDIRHLLYLAEAPVGDQVQRQLELVA